MIVRRILAYSNMNKFLWLVSKPVVVTINYEYIKS
jgi:hypothetical protein